jgi:predicted RND superfamily exporter protein
MQIDDDDLETWVSDDGLRMMIRTEDLDSIDIGRLEDFVAENPQIRVVSGMPVLFDEMNKLVVQSQIRSLGLALALIFIMLLVTIRKLRAALVAMLPIVITIAAILGMLSMTEFHLNIMTANLSAIAIGVGVDYSIHLISGIYYFRKRGLGSIESVDSALSSLSRPILANAFGLAIGLSILFFSPLRIHMQAASVMWVAMVVSSMGALLLIPIFYSRRTEQPEKRAI